MTEVLRRPPNRLLLLRGIVLAYFDIESALSPLAHIPTRRAYALREQRPPWTALAPTLAMAMLAYIIPALAREAVWMCSQALLRDCRALEFLMQTLRSTAL